MTIEDQKEKAQRRNDLSLYLINLIEEGDKRYSMSWSVGHATKIYDKKRKKSYLLRIEEIQEQAQARIVVQDPETVRKKNHRKVTSAAEVLMKTQEKRKSRQHFLTAEHSSLNSCQM